MTQPMPRVVESSLWPIVKRVLPTAQRIETGIALGIPDVLYSRHRLPDAGAGHHGFIELKVARWQRKGMLKITFRPGQVKWLTERDTTGGHVWIFVITEANVLWLIQGRMAETFAKPFSISTLEMYAIYCGTKSKPDYNTLQRQL